MRLVVGVDPPFAPSIAAARLKARAGGFFLVPKQTSRRWWMFWRSNPATSIPSPSDWKITQLNATSEGPFVGARWLALGVYAYAAQKQVKTRG